MKVPGGLDVTDIHEHAGVLAPTQRVIGRSVPFRGAEAIVTGTLRYLTDLSFDHMLHVCVVRSSVPHGRLRAVHTAAAQATPGVVTVLTAADVPHLLVGAMVALAQADTTLVRVIGTIGVFLGAGNAVGGYVVTERMLQMFVSAGKKKGQR